MADTPDHLPAFTPLNGEPSLAPFAPDVFGVSDIAIPEFFPGFTDLITQEEERFSAVEGRMQVLFSRQQELIEQLEKPSILDKPHSANIFAAGILSLADLGKAREEDELVENLKQIGLELQSFTRARRHSTWRLRVAQIIIQYVRNEGVTTVNEVLQRVPFEIVDTEDRAFVQALLDGFRPNALELQGEGTIEDTEQKIFEIFQERRGSFKEFFSLSPGTQTSEEIIAGLERAARFSPPEGITGENTRRLLNEQQFSDAEITEELFDAKAEAERIAAAMIADDALLAALEEDLGGLATGSIVSGWRKARLLQAASQPVSAFFVPLEYWNERVTQPILGFALHNRLLATIVNSKDYQDFDRKYSEARWKGKNQWEAWGDAVNEWEVNGLLKFLLITGADPTTYVGMMVYTNTIGKLPLIGRFVGIAERGYVRGVEVAFDGLRQVFLRTVAVPLSTRGYRHSKNAWDLTRHYLETASDIKPKRPIRHLTAEEVTGALEVAIEAALTNPQNPSDAAKLGKILLGPIRLAPDDIDGLVVRTGAQGIQIDATTIASVNDVLESTDGFGVTKFLMPDEAAPQILRKLRIVDSPENLTIAKQFLIELRDGLKSRALRRTVAHAGDENPTLGIMGRVMDGARDDFLGAQADLIAGERFQEGLIAASFHYVTDTTRNIWLNGIDQAFVMPFSRAYLLFGFYGLFNVLETGMKAVFAGLNPFYFGRRSGQRAGVIFFGLKGNLPVEIVEIGTRFTPQLGAELPADSIQALANSARSRIAANKRRELTKKLADYMTASLNPEWLKTGTGFNLAAKMGGAQRTYYYVTMYQKLLTEFDSETIEVIEIAARVLTDELIARGLANSKYAQAYGQELANRLMTGDKQQVLNLVTDFTPGAVEAAEVAKIMQNFPTLNMEFGDFIVQHTRSGRLWQGGPKGVNDLFEKQLTEVVYARYFSSPKLFSDRFAAMVDDVISMAPANMGELNLKMNIVDQVVQTYQGSTDTALRAAQSYAERNMNARVKNDFYTDFWDNHVNPHVLKGGEDIKRMIEDMKLQLRLKQFLPEMNDIQRVRYLSILDSELEITAQYQSARQAEDIVRRKFTRPSGSAYLKPGSRTDIWWDDFLTERRAAWENVNELIAEQRYGQTGVEAVKMDIEAEAGTQFIESPLDVAALGRGPVPDDIAKLFGVSSAELSRNMYMPEIMALRGRADFIKTVSLRVQRGGATLKKTADELGYSKEAIGDVYDQIMFTLRADPQVERAIEPTLLELEGLRQEVLNLGLRRKTLVSDDVTDFLREHIDGVVAEMGPLQAPGVGGTLERVSTPEWQQTRERALEETNKRFVQDFPDYNNTTVIGKTLKVLYPFATYESHRWAFWIPREVLRHPGTATAWGRYEDNTDSGYIHIPGTSLDTNPFRGTIWMGGMRRLFMRDYPEFYDRFEGAAELLDYFSRWGFFPGPHISFMMATFGANYGRPQFGAILPPAAKSIIDLAMAVDPEHAGRLLQAMFPDNFRNLELSNIASSQGHEGVDLLEKLQSGVPFNDDEQAQWDAASRELGPLLFAMEQTALLRVRPEEKIELFEAANAIIAADKRVTPAFIADIRRTGSKLSDVLGPLSPEAQRLLNALENYSRYMGAGVSLLPSEHQQVTLLIREFYTTLGEARLKRKDKLLQIEQELFQGLRTVNDWKQQLRSQQSTNSQLLQGLKESNPRYADVPVTQDERVDFAERYGLTMQALHPLEEMRALYFNNDLVERYNYDTDTIEPDWTSFFLYRKQVEEGAGTQFNRLAEFNAAESTPLTQVYFEINKEYIRPYKQVFDVVLKDFPIEEQRIILRHRKAQTPEERRGFEAVITTRAGLSDRTIISVFTEKVRIFHENLRDIDPQLDAWLLFFGEVKSPRTEEAEVLLTRIRRQLGFAVP